jgi:glycosyltransferase involved in cell wall biosynthesis
MPLPLAPLGVARPTVNLIVPFHNESTGVTLFFEALRKIVKDETHYEFIAIDDGSTDNTLEILYAEQKKDPRIRVVRLSRNFGKEAALAAGIDLAAGDAVIILDGDLQHPVSCIPQMIEKWHGGAEMVLMLRENRSESLIKKRLSELFYRILNSASEINIIPGENDFRLLDKKVVRELRNLKEKTRFTKGLFAWVGFRKSILYYEQPARVFGSPKQNYRKLFSLAMNGFLSFSVLPIRLFAVAGAITASVSIVYAGFIFYQTIHNGIQLPGYASLAVALFFFGGVQMLGLGVLGEYIARIFSETKDRPLYIIADDSAAKPASRSLS